MCVLVAIMLILLSFIMVVILICFQLTVIWKVVEKLLVPAPKQSKSSTAESQPASQGFKWSAGTNLLSRLGAKIERQSKQKLNEFARELRSFSSIDMSGMVAGLMFKKDIYVYLTCF